MGGGKADLGVARPMAGWYKLGGAHPAPYLAQRAATGRQAGGAAAGAPHRAPPAAAAAAAEAAAAAGRAAPAPPQRRKGRRRLTLPIAGPGPPLPPRPLDPRLTALCGAGAGGGGCRSLLMPRPCNAAAGVFRGDSGSAMRRGAPHAPRCRVARRALRRPRRPRRPLRPTSRPPPGRDPFLKALRPLQAPRARPYTHSASSASTRHPARPRPQCPPQWQVRKRAWGRSRAAKARARPAHAPAPRPPPAARRPAQPARRQWARALRAPRAAPRPRPAPPAARPAARAWWPSRRRSAAPTRWVGAGGGRWGAGACRPLHDSRPRPRPTHATLHLTHAPPAPPRQSKAPKPNAPGGGGGGLDQPGLADKVGLSMGAAARGAAAAGPPRPSRHAAAALALGAGTIALGFYPHQARGGGGGVTRRGRTLGPLAVPHPHPGMRPQPTLLSS
jgi:hypothetical protein